MIHVVKLEYGGKIRDYAVGLWWQVPKGGMASAKIMLGHARARAQEFRDPEQPYNVVALRRHQFGLGHMKGKPKRLFSLAAGLTPNVLSFIGIFCLEGSAEDGVWWLCAIRQGSVAGDGDRVYSSLSAAREGARKLLNYMDTTTTTQVEKLTPADSIAYMTPLLRTDAMLEELFPDPAARARRRKLIALGLFVLVAAYGGWTWWERLERRQEMRALQAEEVRKRQEGQQVQDSAAELFPRPWMDAPLADALIRACIETAGKQPLYVSGWEWENTTCAPGYATIQYGHRPGANYENLPAGMALTTPGESIRKLALSTVRRPSEHLEKVDALTRRLYQLAQDYALRVRVGWKPQERKTIDQAEVVSPWKTGEFELADVPVGALLTGELGTRLNLPGCLIRSIQLVPGKEATIKGAIHAYP